MIKNPSDEFIHHTTENQIRIYLRAYLKIYLAIRKCIIGIYFKGKVFFTLK